TVRTTTSFSATAGADRISPLTPARQRSAPVSAANAITWPSPVPTATRSAPTPVPPVSSSLVLVRQTCLPVLRSKAATSPSRPAAYSRPPPMPIPSPRRSFLPPPPTLAPHTLSIRTVGFSSFTSSAGFSTFFLSSFDLQALSTIMAASSSRENFFIGPLFLRTPLASSSGRLGRRRGGAFGRIFGARGRRAAEIANLEIEQIDVDPALVLADTGREIFAQRAGAIALGEQHVPADLGEARGEFSRLVDLERGQGIVVLGLGQLHARQAQAG